ncbi:invs, partial [Symbiodinium pilosum]
DQQDLLELRQREAERRLAAAEEMASQRAEELQELASEHKTRVSSLESELVRACKEEKSQEEAAQDLKSDISKREAELLESLANSEAHQASEAALRKALHMQEKLLADERVDHDTVQRQLAESVSEVQELLRSVSDMQARQKEHEVLRLNLELRQARADAAADAKLKEAASIEASLREKLQDVWSKLASKTDLSLNPDTFGDPLLDSVFAQKAAKIHRKVLAALRRAGDAHHAAIELELSLASQPSDHVGDGDQATLRSLLSRSNARRSRLAQELQEMLAQVQSTLLLKCAEGADAGSDEEELAAERLELDAQLISQELPLLKSDPLHGVPKSVLKAMASLCSLYLEGGEDMDGRHPMHWAAKHGRRDVIEFLLRYIYESLNQRDPDGRTPLFYAERAGNDALAAFLRENGCDANPQEPVQRRPVTGTVPEAFADVIKVVEERGWHAVNWMEGFTLLHWAAEKGLADFCRYFVDLNADVNAVDSRGRTALQCAINSKNSEAELVLRELMGLVQATSDRMLGDAEEELAQMQEVASSTASNGQSGGIPAAYVRVMQQIDLIGWEKMHWARGFTLLHWAAKHDRADLCELFLWYGADPEHQDDQGHSALDYARIREPQASAALGSLLRGREMILLAP